MSLAVSPLASVHATGKASRTRPPSSSDSGMPRRRACASISAVSIAHLAKRLPWIALRMRAMQAATRLASWPISSGAMWVSMLTLMLSGLSSP